MLVYLAVANLQVILAECSSATGTFKEIAHKVLRSATTPDYDTRVSYSAGDHKFHLLVSNGMRYLCLADHSDGHKLPFSVLDKVHARFRDRYGVIGKSAVDNSRFMYEFNPILAEILDASKLPSASKERLIREDLDQVRDMALQGIDRVLERGERIDNLVEKTSLLSDQSMQFQRSSTRLRQHMWWQHIKMRVVLALGVFVMLMVIFFSVCGWGLASC